MKRKTCTYHCRTCDRHFHGLEAFDQHRVFEDPRVEDWSTRKCGDPEYLLREDGNPELVPYTTEGYCAIQAEKLQHPVTIWQKWRPDRHEPVGQGVLEPVSRQGMISEGGNIQVSGRPS